MATYEEQLLKFAQKRFPDEKIVAAQMDASASSGTCDTCDWGTSVDIELGIKLENLKWRWIDLYDDFAAILKEIIEA